MLNDVVLSSSEHNHDLDPGKIEAAKVVSAIRTRAVEGGGGNQGRLYNKPEKEFRWKEHLICRHTSLHNVQ